MPGSLLSLQFCYPRREPPGANGDQHFDRITTLGLETARNSGVALPWGTTTHRRSSERGRRRGSKPSCRGSRNGADSATQRDDPFAPARDRRSRCGRRSRPLVIASLALLTSRLARQLRFATALPWLLTRPRHQRSEHERSPKAELHGFLYTSKLFAHHTNHFRLCSHLPSELTYARLRPANLGRKIGIGGEPSSSSKLLQTACALGSGRRRDS